MGSIVVLNFYVERKEVERNLLKSIKTYSNSDFHIIDVMGSCEDISLPKVKVTNIKSFIQNVSQTEKQARETLLESVYSRSIIIKNQKCLNLNYYWLTPWAVKHPTHHWGYSLSLFKVIIQNNIEVKDIFNSAQKIFIYFPVKDNKAVRQMFENLLNRKVYVPYVNSFILRLKRQISYLKNTVIFFKTFLKLLKLGNGDKVEVHSNIMVLNNVHPTRSNDFKDFFNESKSSFIALNFNRLQSTDYLENNVLFNSEYSEKLNIGSILKLIIGQFIFKLKLMCEKYNRKGLDRIIIGEIDRINNSLDTLYSYFVLKEFFSKIQKATRIFYADEFYRVGRIVSSSIKASNNRNIESYGFQHGLIGEHHTVYCIGEKEAVIIPKPDYFVVWGSFFKKQFLRYNNLSESFVKIGLHPKFSFLPQSIDKNKNSEIIRVLWCTTELNMARYEYQVIESLFETTSIQIIIRYHPNFPLDKDLISFMNSSHIAKIKIDANESIFDSIKCSDVIVCTNPSTVMLDALLNDIMLIAISSFVRLPIEFSAVKSGLLMLSQTDRLTLNQFYNSYNLNKGKKQNDLKDLIDIDSLDFWNSFNLLDNRKC